MADLSRDAEHASGSIGPIFDKEKEQRRLQEVQLTGEIGSGGGYCAHAGRDSKTEGDKDPAALTAAEAKLKAEGNSSPTAEQIADRRVVPRWLHTEPAVTCSGVSSSHGSAAGTGGR